MISFQTEAQISTDQQRILKYWYYREKLKTKFILGIGPERGESIPASIREEATNKPPLAGSVDSKVKWGDATIDLAYYILVLGLEYDLLNQNNQNTDPTLTELFYAIDAFNRLDYYAEDYYGKNRTLDGFYTRDDVCYDCFNLSSFYLNPNQSYTTNKTKLNAQSQGSNITQIESSYSTGIAEDDFEAKVTSMDHNIHLFMALSIIIQRIDASPPNGLTFMDGLSNYKDEAKAIMVRIIDYMHKPSNLNGFSKWIIKDPNGKKLKNKWGGHAWFMAPGFSTAAFRLCGHNNPSVLMKSIDANWHFCVGVYKIVQSQYWYFLTNPDALKYLNFMAMTGPHSLGNGTVSSFTAKIMYYSGNYLSSLKYPTVHIPMLTKYLYSTVDVHPKSYYEGLLDDAPCFGPYNYSYKSFSQVSFPSHDWSATTLTIHPERRGDNSPDFPGEYNGLDYMMLFNLFYLNENEPIKKYFTDLYHNNMLTDFPTSSNYGSSGDPANIISHSTILASNHISSSGNVEYRAGKSIDLNTNFTVDANAAFYAHIDDVECVGVGNEFERMKINQEITVETKPTRELENTGKLEVVAFPVPFSENFNIQLSTDKATHAIVKLISAEGKLINVLFDGDFETPEYFLSFSTNNLQKGFYMVTVEANGNSKALKLIKSK
jgi:hypothetical protein